MIHSTDNTKVKMKITDDGDLFIYCPECRSVWQTSLNVIGKPPEGRPINYGGTGIKLDMAASAKPQKRKSSDGKTAVAKALFPEAFE